MQPNLSSGLGPYIADEFMRRSFRVCAINALSRRRYKLIPLLKSLSLNRGEWWKKRGEYTLFSSSAWHRNTRINGRSLDCCRKANPELKILQVGKEYFPHPDYRNIEYYVFIHYTMRCSVTDGVTPWLPAEHDREAFFALEEELYQHAAHLFVGGAYLKRHLVSDYHVKENQITVVGGGVNNYFLEHPPDVNELNESRTCLFVGWDFGMKGGKDLIEAFTIARKTIPGLRLLVVGPQRDEVPLCDGVECLGPVSDKRQLLQWYRQADLFVMPSLRDSFGFAFLEAMSQGLPCIGTRLNAMPEIIHEERTGYIVNRHDPADLANAIIRHYRKGQEQRSKMRWAAVDRVQQRYTWSHVVDRMWATMYPEAG
jgi:glycosyltransferase involved in cell wall biosynthesis